MIRKIINAMIVDGSGEKPFLGGVEIAPREDGVGVITRVFRGPSRDEGEGVVDAKGMTLTPGFVDIHRHHDLAALYDPDFGHVELAQGITTAVAGNCGLSAFPNSPEFREAQFSYIEPVMGKVPDDCKLTSFADFMNALDHTALPLNVASLTGVCATATSLIGYAPRPFTPKEREKAARLVDEAMEAGAVGLSYGIMYLPESYLSYEDLVAVARECAKYGGVMTTHIRGEGDSLVPSIQEVISIAKEAGCALEVSHFKCTGVRNWHKGILEAIALIEKAREEGQDVTVDAYPYPAGATTALSLIPPSVIEGKPLSYLATPEGVEKLRSEIYNKQPGWDNMVESIGWERILVGSVTLEKNRIYSGMTIDEAAKFAARKEAAELAGELTSTDQVNTAEEGLPAGYIDPCEWFGKIVAEEDGKVGIILMSQSPEDVERILKLPYATVISDSLYGGGDNPHPRLYGSFPRVLREYVRERHVFTLEEAIQKMTSMPAARVGLLDRGLIRVGYAADLNLFDPELITDHATFTNSKQLSDGIAMTLVNGNVAMQDGKLMFGEEAAKQGDEAKALASVRPSYGKLLRKKPNYV